MFSGGLPPSLLENNNLFEFPQRHFVMFIVDGVVKMKSENQKVRDRLGKCSTCPSACLKVRVGAVMRSFACVLI